MCFHSVDNEVCDKVRQSFRCDGDRSFACLKFVWFGPEMDWRRSSHRIPPRITLFLSVYRSVVLALGLSWILISAAHLPCAPGEPQRYPRTFRGIISQEWRILRTRGHHFLFSLKTRCFHRFSDRRPNEGVRELEKLPALSCHNKLRRKAQDLGVPYPPITSAEDVPLSTWTSGDCWTRIHEAVGLAR